jgi:hypothetical protein
MDRIVGDEGGWGKTCSALTSPNVILYRDAAMDRHEHSHAGNPSSHAHGHEPIELTTLLASAAARLGVAVAASVVLWLAVLWALR